MTTTNVMFLGIFKGFRTEAEAYIWTVNQLIAHSPGLLTKLDAGAPQTGRRGKEYFSRSPVGMIQPKRLDNGCYAETCQSNDGKVQRLDDLSRAAGLKRGHDWTWAAQHRYTHEFIDVGALLAELESV